MRVKLELEPTGKNAIIPINYQYELSAWIYNRLHLSDSRFSAWLHKEGFRSDGKQFKLFTFSHLKVENRRINGDRLHIFPGNVEFQVSFAVDRTVEHFLQGLFENQELNIFDKISKGNFRVKNVQTLKEPNFDKNQKLRCISPICVSRKNKDESVTYLDPRDSEYLERIQANLERKLSSASISLHGKSDLKLKITSEPKSRLIRIKADKASETKIRAFQFPMILEGSPELLKMAYQAGIGEKNSLGFGCVEAVG